MVDGEVKAKTFKMLCIKSAKILIYMQVSMHFLFFNAKKNAQKAFNIFQVMQFPFISCLKL